jgi:hypothetical protein
MTFGELVTLIRDEIIVDEYADAYTVADIRNTLWRAAYEIASSMDFPRAVATPTLTPGNTSIPLANVARIHSISVGGDDGRLTSYRQVIRSRMGAANGPIRYYNWDPRRNSDIEISPPSSGGTALIEYTKLLVRPVTVELFDAAQPWDGVLSNYHPVVAYRAAIPLFQMAERQDEVNHWREEYNQRVQEMAASLNRTDISRILMRDQPKDTRGPGGVDKV